MPEVDEQQSIRRHTSETLRLALPVAVGRIGILLIVSADVAMTGRYSSVELAELALASGPFMPLLLFGIGALMGVLTLTAQASGAGRLADTGAVLRAGLALAVGAGIILGALSAAGEWLFLSTGQDETLAAGAGAALLAFGVGIPGALVFACCTYYLEALRRPLPGVAAMAVANVLNIALNQWLIHGGFGVDAMGGTGAALATSIVRWTAAGILVFYIWRVLDADRHGLRKPLSMAKLEQLARLGLPIGIAQAVESSAFAMMTLLAGMIGVLALAGFQIAFSVQALLFMTALGLSTAANVRVGIFIGRNDVAGASTAGWVALAVTVIVLAALGGTVALFAPNVAGIFSEDPDVIPIAVATLLIGAIAIIPDGAQTTLMGALRGAADVWPATLRFLVSFWGIMVPFGWYFGVQRGGGAPALMEGVLWGALVCVLLLAQRFVAVIRTLRPPLS